jgi:hypothetical protein
MLMEPHQLTLSGVPGELTHSSVIVCDKILVMVPASCVLMVA